MTVFVGIASPAAELATLLGKPTPPGNATPSLIISKLVPDDTLVSLIEDESANDKTASLFQLVLSFLDGMDVQDVAKLADRFTACLEKDVNNAELRLGLLIRLCNAVAVASIKARVFTSLLKYSLRSNLSASVLQSCSHIDDWTKEWALDANAQLQLMAQVAAIYAANGRDQDAHKIRVRILSLQLSDPVPHDVLSEHTAHVIAHVLRTGDILYLDALLAKIKKMSLLQKSPLLDLLHRMSSGTVQDLDQFVGQHGAILDQYRLDGAQLRSYQQSLALCTAAARSRNLRISDLKETLGVTTDDEVEQAVITAVTLGIVDAQIDQDEGSVDVLRCAYRSLSADTWKDLQRRLNAWRDNVANVLPWNQHVPN
ncbi:PCI domain-containing protein [Plasmodiophora brassicae]|uniref:PCI domain-containing protein n=1 Tax=Plasmodiophora brassicae TaxID=37360 RepID=A0A0G4IVZ6_PLABS|nr:hypothetical protein PBRA_001381 [Plasmodiophora brassicae]SPQ97482.1 unnamed protein product [Plasmodiophora brassicae]